MNIEKHLILIKGEDKTEQISQCKYENGKWQVQFGQGKTYSYGYLNVQWLRDPVVHTGDATVVYQNKQPLSGVEKIYDFGEYIRICFVSGYKKVYGRGQITLSQSCLLNPYSRNVLKYLGELAEKVSVTDEDDSSFLSRQYAKLTWVSPDSALAKHLNPTALNSTGQVLMPIFPFGFNLSQKEATEKVLTSQISVIEGPPGTGKTQTILNIIANAVMDGKTVAIVSNNNAATANVLEKLQKYAVSFIAAYLGNKANKEKFFAEQTQSYPDMAKWEMDASSYDAVKKSLEASGSELGKMLAARNELALLKQELAALAVEIEHFKIYHAETNTVLPPYRSFFEHSSATVMVLWQEYQRLAERESGITLFYKLKNLLLHGIYSFSFFENQPEQVIACFQQLYYARKEKELKEKIEALKQQLASYRFDSAMQKYSTASMQLFKAKLAARFYPGSKRTLFTNDVLWKCRHCG